MKLYAYKTFSGYELRYFKHLVYSFLYLESRKIRAYLKEIDDHKCL